MLAMFRTYVSGILSCNLGPVVQSIISLTRSLVENLFSLTAIRKSIAVIYFLEIIKSFCNEKAPYILFSKNGHNFAFNTFEILTSR